MDTAESANSPREVTLGGETFLVSALTRAEWGPLTAWLKDHGRDPLVAAMESLARARAAGVEVAAEDRKALLAQAAAEARAWPPRPASARWFEVLEETEGASPVFVRAVLRKHQPSLTDADAGRVEAAATPEESQRLIYRAIGYVPVPKAEAGAGAESPAPSPTTGPGSTPP